MHINESFQLTDLRSARDIVAENPFATLVSGDLQATHMPCLVEENATGLTVVGHVAREDPFASRLGQPMLVIFQGPHGYVSASWYAADRIPTWNHVTLHIRGEAELLADALPVLRRTVDHLETRIEQPWSLDRMEETARQMADRVVAFRLTAQSWHAEAKLSQDKPADERRRVEAALEGAGAYANPALAAAMRRWSTGGAG